MLGYVSFRAGAASAAPVREVGGIPVRAVSVLPGDTLRARFSARTAACALLHSGVRRAVFEEKAIQRAAFVRRGIEELTAAPLFRATAAALTRRCMAQRALDPRRSVVALAAEASWPELWHAAEALCADVRYLVLAAPDGAMLAARLRRSRGVAVHLAAPDSTLRADLTVAFDDVRVPAATLRLDSSLHAVYSGGMSIAALTLRLCAGALDADALHVESVMDQ